MKHPVTWVSLEMSAPAILCQYFNALCTYQLPPLKVTIRTNRHLSLDYQETFHWRNARLQTSEMVDGNLVEGPWCWKLAIFCAPKTRGTQVTFQVNCFFLRGKRWLQVTLERGLSEKVTRNDLVWWKGHDLEESWMMWNMASWFFFIVILLMAYHNPPKKQGSRIPRIHSIYV